MPTLCPYSVSITTSLIREAAHLAASSPRASELHFDVDARRQREFRQRLQRARVRIEHVDQPLVRAHLKLLTRVLVDKRRAVHRELLDLRRQGDRPRDGSARALRRL